MLIIADIIRFVIEGIFCYYVFNMKRMSKLDKRSKIIEVSQFVGLFTITLAILDIITNSNVLLRAFSIVFTIIYFIIKLYKKENWKFISTYSFFVNCVLEFNNMLSAFSAAIVAKILSKVIGLNEYISYISGTFTVVFIYVILIFIIYKLEIVNINAIRLASKDKIMFISFIVYMFIILLIKYEFTTLDKSEWSIFGTIVFVVISPTFIYVMLWVNKNYEKRSEETNRLEDSKIKRFIEMVNIEVPVSCKYDVYNNEKRKYENLLLDFCMTVNDMGYSQLVLAIIIARHFKGSKLRLGKDVYDEVAKVLGNTNGKAVAANISNTIKSGWERADLDVLSEMYPQYVNPEQGVPTNGEFILFMAKIPNLDNAGLRNKKENTLRVTV